MVWKRSILLAIMLAGLLLFGCTQNGSGSPSPQSGYGGSSGSGGSSAPQTGRTVFGMTDAAADMGSVSSVQMTVNQVQVHSATQGWVSVSSTPKTVDLMQLKAQGSTTLLADTKLAEGTYDQMRMDVSDVTVVDSQGSHPAKLPSNELKFDGDLVVKANSTSSASFDVLADESLHLAGKAQGQGEASAKYVMAPVLHVQTRSDAHVDASSDSDVKISGGNLDTDAKIGMDIHGKMGVGLEIPADVDVVISSTGVVSVLGSGSGSANSSVSGIIGVGSAASGSTQGSASGSIGGGVSGTASSSGSSNASGSASGGLAGAIG